jgi:hypothetical protein
MKRPRHACPKHSGAIAAQAKSLAQELTHSVQWDMSFGSLLPNRRKAVVIRIYSVVITMLNTQQFA